MTLWRTYGLPDRMFSHQAPNLVAVVFHWAQLQSVAAGTVSIFSVCRSAEMYTLPFQWLSLL